MYSFNLAVVSDQSQGQEIRKKVHPRKSMDGSQIGIDGHERPLPEIHENFS